MAKYYPPKVNKEVFNCALCGAYATQVWRRLRTEALYYHEDQRDTDFIESICHHCQRPCYWHKDRMIVPSEAPVVPPHEDLPESCHEEYGEAREIFARSPRAAAALLRLCVEKLLKEITGETKAPINDMISSLVAKGLPEEIQQSLDYCRLIGNNAVHSGTIDFNESSDVAECLFEMVNWIVEDRISRPKRAAERYASLPAGARAAIEKRDAKASQATQAATATEDSL